MSHLLLFAFLVSSASLFAGDSADAIMARVAVNQNRAIELRGEYVYQQRVDISTRRTNGKLARREIADYLITPTASGIEKNLQKLDGKYSEKGQTVEFHGEPAPKRDSMDGDLVQDFRNDLLNGQTKDGIANDLFPFTAGEQKKYRFDLDGEQLVDGRKAYRIRFRPADKHEFAWSGEALIDEEECQPVTVYTKLAHRVPVAVRTLLGTDLPGIGFSVRYQRLEKDVWFPVSFGTEFRLRALFFINRDITIASESTGFRRTKVDSTIRYH